MTDPGSRAGLWFEICLGGFLPLFFFLQQCVRPKNIPETDQLREGNMMRRRRIWIGLINKPHYYQGPQETPAPRFIQPTPLDCGLSEIESLDRL